MYLCRDDCLICSQKLLSKTLVLIPVNYSECYILEWLDPGERVRHFTLN